MRSFLATKNLIAVSAYAKETALNTEQTLDLSLLAGMGDIINLDNRREDNADEANGNEEPDTIYDLGASSSGPLNFEKAQPQHFAFLMAYALGAISTAAAGTGYEHTITPLSGDEDNNRSNPTFTTAQRYGETVLKRRFASMAVDSVNATFAKDDWVKLAASLKGTGKYDDNITNESLSALDDAADLTLAANAVEGATAQARLDNVQRIRAEYDGGWVDIDYSAVSAATPAVITITDPGGAGASITYEVLYIPDEAAWCTFPARVTETPLRVSQATFSVGGTWDGSAFDGGRQHCAEIDSVEYSLANNLAQEFVPCADNDYAARIFRDGRVQTLKFNRE